jgi:ABC-2 type transport system permease protein/lipopolysaccharide transport system permease protein
MRLTIELLISAQFSSMGQDLMSGSDAAELRISVEAPWPAAPSNAGRAWADLRDGVSKSWFWSALAMQDIKLRYRGSIIGPFWMTLSTVIMIAAMGFIYTRLFHQDVSVYLPFLTLGIIMWNFISMSINEGCQTFSGAVGLIQQVPLPFSIHAYRTVYRNLIVTAHSLVIVPPVILIFHVHVNLRILEVIPAIVILSINGVWFCILFGMLCARFRDVPMIVQSFIGVLFFVTPIFWPPEQLGPWQKTFELNPLFALIDIVRSPVLGKAPAVGSWPVVVVLAAFGCTVTFALFSRFRSRIAYWV